MNELLAHRSGATPAGTGTGRAYWVAVALLAVLLATFIAISWPAIQDDALIHLRYADNLRRVHFISYDGVQPNFGTSSVLYVSLLALLTAVTSSPNLPRAVSDVAHVLLFGGLAFALAKRLPAGANLARLTAVTLLWILAAPSSVRWLDDGMETGLVLCLVSGLALFTFSLMRRETISAAAKAELFAFGLALMLLRTELAMLAGIAWAMLASGRARRGGANGDGSARAWVRAAIETVSLPLGCLGSCAVLLLTMHHLLPDTALAKAEGARQWDAVLGSTVIILGGSFTVGAGLGLFWIVTAGLVLASRRMNLATALANTVFPVLLLLSALRGQAMQGARYVLWAFLFSCLWNVLRLGEPSPGQTESGSTPWQMRTAWAMVAVLAVVLPIDGWVFSHLLSRRSETIRQFSSQHLGELAGMQGTSMDIGYIGYFSQAKICDLAGLVNGRDLAKLNVVQRTERCASLRPDFVFGTPSQIRLVMEHQDLTGWRVCDAYDLMNVRAPDRHYLLASPERFEKICGATGRRPGPPEELAAVARRPF